MKKVLFMWSVCLLFVACKSTKTLTPEQLEKKEAIAERVESRDYSIMFNQLSPTRGRSVNLSPGYTLTVKNDSVSAYLPYFGVSRTPAFDGDGGVKFEEPYSNYLLQPTSKNDGTEVRMEVKTVRYQYTLFLVVYENGNCTLSVSSPQRDPITYYGELE